VPQSLSLRAVGEWEAISAREYENPFLDVSVDAEFEAPSGATYAIPGFYDGDGTWRVRFSAGEPGTWRYRIRAFPDDPELTRSGAFDVVDRPTRGFLAATPGDAWGFRYESGEPVLLLGDTVYNLLAETYVGNDIRPYLQRRAEQGFNLLRISLVALPFCPPNAYAHWSDRRIWPWGGSDWWPQFDRFDLDYFRSVDETVRLVDEAGLGLEMIMEFPGAASPFVRRELFTAEWEELWLRWLVARYDAYASVYFWTLCNEYEYLTGQYRHTQEADRWALRTARLVKRFASHGHPVAVHSGPELPPFAWRFRADPAAIDAILYQTWGSKGPHDGWLAAGIEDTIGQALDGWRGSAMHAEYGYETAPELRHIMPGHQWLDAEHTRRGAWRTAFCALGVTAGFHPTWWGFGDYSKDQQGVVALTHLRRFLTEVVSFEGLRPDPDLVADGPTEYGHRPLALADADRGTVAVYLPAGGTVRLALDVRPAGDASWFDPRTGEISAADIAEYERCVEAKSPGGGGDRPFDWTLVLTGR
jgi:Protein of unknown function (DUF4038)/Domain of unknown function (DUF5060)/Putative collagen-binding domain of a collagenase